MAKRRDRSDLAAALAEATAAALSPNATPEPRADERELLCVRLKQRLYAIPIEAVSAVIRPTKLAPVPHVPDYVRGVLNHQGKITAVLDLARFAGAEPEEEPKRLIMITAGELEAAVPVTDVAGVVTCGPEEIEPPLPHLEGQAWITGALRHGDEVFLVIDPAKLLLASRIERKRGA
jgi:purine-binding chemotaxis protein CheW